MKIWEVVPSGISCPVMSYIKDKNKFLETRKIGLNVGF